MVVVVVVVGGGGFFLACEHLGATFDRLRFFFFFPWRLARAHKFHSLYKDQSIVTLRAEMTVAECSLTKLPVSSFLDKFPHYVWTADSQPTPTSLGSGCMRR